MGKTYKDRRKFDRKHDKHDGLKEVKREKKNNRNIPIDDDELYDELYDDE